MGYLDEILKGVVFLFLLLLVAGCSMAEIRAPQSLSQPYMAEIEEAERRGSPLVIKGIRTSRPNAAGGVDLYIDFISVSDLPVKYVDFVVTPYNAVHDAVLSAINRRGDARVRSTGPYYRGSTSSEEYWQNVWYNTTIACGAIKAVTVTFMDGTSKHYTGGDLGDLFARGYINSCGNNSVRSALDNGAISRATLVTSKGDVVIELYSVKAPETVASFIAYAREGFYNNTIFHRVIPGFMIQGGGFNPQMQEKPTHEPIRSEANNGLSNKAGTIALARSSDPHSGAAQFFINVGDNKFLDFKSETRRGWGYTVFGSVIEGMDVVQNIANTPTGIRGEHRDVPRETVLIRTVIVD